MNAIGSGRLGRLLAVMVLQGLLSLEDLDQPHDGIQWIAIEASRSHGNSRSLRNKLPPQFPPGTPWRNLAREWINGHPDEWQSLLRQCLEEENQAAAAAALGDPIAAIAS